MRVRNLAIFAAAGVAGILVGSAAGPRPAGAVSREMIELQTSVNSLLVVSTLSVPA